MGRADCERERRVALQIKILFDGVGVLQVLAWNQSDRTVSIMPRAYATFISLKSGRCCVLTVAAG